MRPVDRAPEVQMSPYPLTDRQALPHISPPPVSPLPVLHGERAGVRGGCARIVGHRTGGAALTDRQPRRT